METETKSLLDVVVAIAQISTPILIILLAGAGWFIRSRFERRIKLEESLRVIAFEFITHCWNHI